MHKKKESHYRDTLLISSLCDLSAPVFKETGTSRTGKQLFHTQTSKARDGTWSENHQWARYISCFLEVDLLAWAGFTIILGVNYMVVEVWIFAVELGGWLMSRQSAILFPQPSNVNIDYFLEHSVALDELVFYKFDQWHPLHKKFSWYFQWKLWLWSQSSEWCTLTSLFEHNRKYCWFASIFYV